MSSLIFTKLFCCLSGLTIGFEQASYTAQEGTPLEVCAVILEGSVERVGGVIFTFEAQDGTAGEGCISSSSICSCIPHCLRVANGYITKKSSHLSYCFR